MARKRREKNKNARIAQILNRRSQRKLRVVTSNRDDGALTARADVRLREDVETGRSLTGLSLKGEGWNVRLSGSEARTLYRVLTQAVNG